MEILVPLLVWAMAPKFPLFTKWSKLPLNKGFKNTFELLQFCTQPSICSGYTLGVSHWGASNEHPQHMFLWRNEKIISELSSNIPPEQVLWSIPKWLISTFQCLIQQLFQICLKDNYFCNKFQNFIENVLVGLEFNSPVNTIKVMLSLHNNTFPGQA